MFCHENKAHSCLPVSAPVSTLSLPVNCVLEAASVSGPVSHVQEEASLLSCVVAVERAALRLVCSNDRYSQFAFGSQWGGRNGRLLITMRGLLAVLPTKALGHLKFLKVPSLLG